MTYRLSILSTAAVIMSLLIGLIGCDDAIEPSPSSTETNEIVPFAPPDFNGQIHAYLEASITDNDWYRYTDIKRTKLAFTNLKDYKLANAVFYNVTQVDPGTVSFNNNFLFNNNHNYFYLDDAAFEFDSSFYTWSIEGSNDFPGFTDSLIAPSKKVHILSHKVYDQISKSEPLTITWTPANEDLSVYVALQGDDTTGHAITFSEMTEDDGSFTIPSSVFVNKPNQRVTISLNRGTYKIGTLDDGKNYLMTIYSQHNVDVRLVD